MRAWEAVQVEEQEGDQESHRLGHGQGLATSSTLECPDRICCKGALGHVLLGRMPPESCSRRLCPVRDCLRACAVVRAMIKGLIWFLQGLSSNTILDQLFQKHNKVQSAWERCVATHPDRSDLF